MVNRYNKKVKVHSNLISNYNSLVQTRNIIQKQVVSLHRQHNELLDKVNYGVMHPSQRERLLDKANGVGALLNDAKDELYKKDRALDTLQEEINDLREDIDMLKEKIDKSSSSSTPPTPKKKKWGWF